MCAAVVLERREWTNVDHPLQVTAASKQLHLLFGQWQKDFFLNKSREEAELEQYFLA